MSPLNLEQVAHAICVAEAFNFRGRVGAGAFKETFEILQTNGAAQALKIYKPGASVDRAAREIDAMTRCDHPNIAKVRRIDQCIIGTETYLYSLEEFIPGGTLTARLQSHGLQNADELQALGAPLIDAVGHIAALNLVHRDLKPDNVLLRADGVTPVIVDFGLVRDLAALSITPSWIMQGPGTPFFSPAEQLLNEKAYIDWRADQFSLGVLLSLSAFGIHPYQEPNDSPIDIVTRVSRRGPSAKQFQDAANLAGLPVLIRMTTAWPVQRFRKPEMVAQAWAAQRRTP